MKLPWWSHNQNMAEIVAGNATKLTELRVDSQDWHVPGLRILLKAAPALRLLQASAEVHDRQVARAVLRSEPPFQALRLRRLWMVEGSLETNTDVVSFGSDLRYCTSLEELSPHGMALDTGDALRSIVNACIAIRLPIVSLARCRVGPAMIPELTRLFAWGALRELIVVDGGEMFDEAHESTRLFVDAVRSTAMTRLRFLRTGLPGDVVEAAAFVNARHH